MLMNLIGILMNFMRLRNTKGLEITLKGKITKAAWLAEENNFDLDFNLFPSR